LPRPAPPNAVGCLPAILPPLRLSSWTIGGVRPGRGWPATLVHRLTVLRVVRRKSRRNRRRFPLGALFSVRGRLGPGCSPLTASGAVAVRGGRGPRRLILRRVAVERVVPRAVAVAFRPMHSSSGRRPSQVFNPLAVSALSFNNHGGELETLVRLPRVPYARVRQPIRSTLVHGAPNTSTLPRAQRRRGRPDTRAYASGEDPVHRGCSGRRRLRWATAT